MKILPSADLESSSAKQLDIEVFVDERFEKPIEFEIQEYSSFTMKIEFHEWRQIYANG